MRILHTADWHLGRTLEGRSRLTEQAQFLDELVSIADKEKVDVILMAGDVFDSVNPPALAEKLFYESIKRLSNGGKRPVAVIAGNHDSPERLTAAKPLADSHNITLVGLPIAQVVPIIVPEKNEKLILAALSYPSEARLHELLEKENDELLIRNSYDERVRGLFEKMTTSFTNETINIAMSHLFVAGGNSSDSERPIEVGGAYTVAANSLPATAQYVALGHLHRPQTVKKANTIARYSGSPLAYSFSEANYTKSVSIIEAKANEPVSVTEIPLSSGKPLVKWRASSLTEVYQWLDEGRDQNAWIDVSIHCDFALSMEEIHRLRKLHSGFIHITPIFKELEFTTEKISNIPLDEMFQKFYIRQTGGSVAEPEILNLFLQLVGEEENE